MTQKVNEIKQKHLDLDVVNKDPRYHRQEWRLRVGMWESNAMSIPLFDWFKPDSTTRCRFIPKRIKNGSRISYLLDVTRHRVRFGFILIAWHTMYPLRVTAFKMAAQLQLRLPFFLHHHMSLPRQIYTGMEKLKISHEPQYVSHDLVTQVKGPVF